MALWNNEQYRREQETWVSNHGGTSSQEVVYAILPHICSLLLTTTVVGLCRKYVHRNVRTVLEFLLIVVPCILCCTVLSEHVLPVCIAMILISVVNMILMGFRNNSLSFNMQPACGKRPFITNCRALINTITAVCILAVDFRIFPRKFMKTEVFGYSLMDTGVGLYILANALVAPEARDVSNQPKGKFLFVLSKNMKKSMKSCVPLLVLGFGRFIPVEFTGYQRHITEYGVHWNFFLTLALVKLFTSTITSTIDIQYSLLSGIWILTMHEYILHTNGLKEWILSDAPRDDFVSANREGLVSVPGFVGLYLIGVAVGRLIHSTYENSNMRYKTGQYQHKSLHIKMFGFEFDAGYNESMILCVKLCLITMQMCAATVLCDSYVRVSRRLANAGYCAWILTLGFMMLTLLLLIEIITDILIFSTTDEKDVPETKEKLNKKRVEQTDTNAERTLEIFEAINYNGLFFFLLSNVMTGVINMFIFTLYVKREIHALLILTAYMAVNIISVTVLYRKRIQIKL